MESESDNQAKIGLDVGYLVRSKKFRAPRNWPRNPETCLKQMEMLKEVELLQNVQVQKSLKALMKDLDIDKRKSIGQLQSAREYQKKLQLEKCHKNVQRIRKLYQDKDASVQRTLLPRESSNFAKFVHFVDESMQDTFDNNEEKAHSEECNYAGLFEKHYSSDSKRSSKPVISKSKLEQKLKLPSLLDREATLTRTDESERPLLSPGSLVTLPKLDTKLSLEETRSWKPNFQHCMPVLDSKSKFSIIRMARTLRQNRRQFIHESQTRKKPEVNVPKKPVEEKPFDLFADNYDLLSPRYLASRGTDQEPMQLLDNDSFDEIDRDDFLQLQNRIVPLSPLPIVIKNKRYEKPLTKLELRQGFR